MIQVTIEKLLRTDGITLITGCNNPAILAAGVIKGRQRSHQGATLSLLENNELPRGQSLGATAFKTGNTAIILDTDSHGERLGEALCAAGSGLTLHLLSRSLAPGHLVNRVVDTFSGAKSSILREYFIERIRLLLHTDEFGSATLKKLDAMKRNTIAQQESAGWSKFFADLPNTIGDLG